MDQLALIVSLIAPVLGQATGEPTPLEGGITNRNYRLTLGAADYVIRVPGKDTSLLGIDRGAERIANELAAGLGVAPAVAACLDEPQAIVTRFLDGRPMSEEELRGSPALEEVARALRLVHDCGATLPTTFDTVAIASDYARIARDRGVEPPPAYDAALQRAIEIQERLTGPEHELVPCHNDLLAANFIHDGERLRIVDWEYAGMGDRYFDLGNFAVNNDLAEADEVRLLEAYWGEPPTAQRLAALQAMRFMSDLREAMWGVVQSAVSELDFDFAEYGRVHFDRLARAG